MASDHSRNIGPMLGAPRCGAKTRKGTPCQAPAVSGKARCRMHGGSAGSGAPKGNQNAFKHGLYTAQQRNFDKHVRGLIRVGKEMIDKL